MRGSYCDKKYSGMEVIPFENRLQNRVIGFLDMGDNAYLAELSKHLGLPEGRSWSDVYRTSEKKLPRPFCLGTVTREKKRFFSESLLEKNHDAERAFLMLIPSALPQSGWFSWTLSRDAFNQELFKAYCHAIQAFHEHCNYFQRIKATLIFPLGGNLKKTVSESTKAALQALSVYESTMKDKIVIDRVIFHVLDGRAFQSILAEYRMTITQDHQFEWKNDHWEQDQEFKTKKKMVSFVPGRPSFSLNDGADKIKLRIRTIYDDCKKSAFRNLPPHSVVISELENALLNDDIIKPKVLQTLIQKIAQAISAKDGFVLIFRLKEIGCLLKQAEERAGTFPTLQDSKPIDIPSPIYKIIAPLTTHAETADISIFDTMITNIQGSPTQLKEIWHCMQRIDVRGGVAAATYKNIIAPLAKKAGDTSGMKAKVPNSPTQSNRVSLGENPGSVFMVSPKCTKKDNQEIKGSRNLYPNRASNTTTSGLCLQSDQNSLTLTHFLLRGNAVNFIPQSPEIALQC